MRSQRHASSLHDAYYRCLHASNSFWVLSAVSMLNKGRDLFVPKGKAWIECKHSTAWNLLNLTILRYKKQYTDGTVPSLYRFRSITLNPLYDAAFS